MQRLLLPLLFASCLQGPAYAFLPSQSVQSGWHSRTATPVALLQSASRTRRYALLSDDTSLYDDDDDHHHDNNDDHFDVEAVRQRLEALLVGGGASSGDGLLSREDVQLATPATTRLNGNPPSSPSHRQVKPEQPLLLSPPADVTLPTPPPPLTSIDRERRMAEINILARLGDGDDAVSDLWQLWFHERGAEPAARLELADELMAKEEFAQAELILRELIDEHGVYWAEPVNRLATLFYMQGKLKQAEKLCKVALAVKPWHFGALSGIVAVYEGMHEAAQAQQWAPRRLPTFYRPTSSPVSSPQAPVPNRRRQAWVEQALTSAKQALDEAEQRLVVSFGKPDDHFVKRDLRVDDKRIITNADAEESDAWQ